MKIEIHIRFLALVVQRIEVIHLLSIAKSNTKKNKSSMVIIINLPVLFVNGKILSYISISLV